MNPFQYDFTKYKSTMTSLVTYVDIIIRLFRSEHQTSGFYFELSSAFGLLIHILLQKLNAL
jgi:hypothetical protein